MQIFSCFPALILLFGASVTAAEVGFVAAVNRDMDGIPPASERRNLFLGDQVVQNERIQTSPRGSGQLMFIDQTSLTVAPNSNLVIDEYVYSAAQEKGDLAINLTKGALRFIGGRLTKKRTAIVRTPTATIGIRAAWRSSRFWKMARPGSS